MKKNVLCLDNVCKRFGGVVAADQVSFELTSGKVHGLIGPNGSGKTTMINLISGIYEVDDGTIMLDGELVTNLPSYARARKGITRSFQHPRLLKRSDIRTNIYLGMDLAKQKGLLSSLTSKKDHSLEELLEAAGLKVNMGDSIEVLAYGQQKLLEIVRAVLAKPKVLLLDEPAAGLNYKEMERVVALIDIAIKNNTAVLLVEHAMDLVMSLCNTITVLNFGRQIADGVPKEIQSNEAVIEAYLGGGRSA